MQRIKVRIFSGAVCEQIVFTTPGTVRNIKKAAPRPRFKTEEERAEHRLKISKRRHAQLVNENFSPRSYYSTLTFDNENEVHTFEEARYIRDKLVRRLKYAYPDAVIFIYMGRGKATHRIHFHMLSDGIPAEVIRKQWLYGRVVQVDHLREHNYSDDGEDHGQDYTGLADYLFDHWTPEQGGHRWKQTRNAKKPERETPTVAVREYSESKPPRPPKDYILIETKSTKYGYLYFKYVRKPDPTTRRRTPKAENSS